MSGKLNLRPYRQRAIRYLIEQGISVDYSKGWPSRLYRHLSELTKIPKLRHESQNQYVVRVSQTLKLNGRDVLGSTPAWADKRKINAIYRQCREISFQSGIPHEVDHIIPLQGRKVCGLHVPANLIIIEASVNRQKSNKCE